MKQKPFFYLQLNHCKNSDNIFREHQNVKILPIFPRSGFHHVYNTFQHAKTNCRFSLPRQRNLASLNSRSGRKLKFLY